MFLPTAGSFAHRRNILPQLGHGHRHLLGQDVAERRERAQLPAHELVAATDELDEFARVNVWVAAVVDVLEEFRGDGGEGVGGGGGCVEGLEGGGEGFTD